MSPSFAAFRNKKSHFNPVTGQELASDGFTWQAASNPWQHQKVGLKPARQPGMSEEVRIPHTFSIMHAWLKTQFLLILPGVHAVVYCELHTVAHVARLYTPQEMASKMASADARRQMRAERIATDGLTTSLGIRTSSVQDNFEPTNM